MPLEPGALADLHHRYPRRRAIITGAGSGLGRALALELARHGWTLLLNDVRADALDAVVASGRALGGDAAGACFDVADLDAHATPANAFFDRYAGVDLVFACAGIGAGGSFVDAHPAHLREVVGVNLLGTMWTAKSVLPAMIAAGRGHFVAVASAAAFHGMPKLAVYAATKAAVLQWSETIRSELRPYGVDVTVKLTTFYTSDIAEHTRGSEAEREKARSLVEMASWSAEAVACELLLAVQKRRFYMVAPGQARLLWLAKRIAPELYLRVVPSLSRKLEVKLVARAAARRAAGNC